ncbi:4-hydroxythreonine-4-phosphate dehydrogenase PdxA [Lactobacillus xylocopicola]|uniref:4-hydroxythreonine-4-phosphate dehydrogenase n=1 Tax=Lactobacillus xylocopicola TaxID=2976676 RepID=A0ABN6SNT2_9LACO|nr:4-hydroxythreonine-4-phosphate dehydrogenase PdxA [Lactobacillus xylocopicola]BDR60951.1 4-hydroxythreonine-4-phosphate dehydrogenase [Lactobacillus xylocopicola]
MEREYIVITMGDPAGIGPEEVVKSLSKPEIHQNAKVLVVGDKRILENISKIVKSDIKINVINAPAEGDYRAGVLNLIDLDNIDMNTFEYGKVQAQCGQAAYEYIEKANDLCMHDGVAAMVTTTLNKEALQQAGITTLGHTDILAKLTGITDPLTMFQVQNMRVFFYSKHLALRKACDLITKDGIKNYVHLMIDALGTMGIENPHVAVAGLNPHAGDGGLFGDEEIKYITPAIKELQAAGINVSGPIAADSVFYQANMGKFDGVLSLYHDQGHIATKTVDPDLTVSFTHNLPYLRTSVDHGTAFDIAGQGIAREKSLDEAIRLAAVYAGDFRRAKEKNN